MRTSADPARRFTSDNLAGLDEPVRRYFSHAIRDGAALPHGVRIAMSGRIKVGLWLPFTAEQTVDGRSFAWRARVVWGPLTPLRVTDRYADAAGSTDGCLLGHVMLFHAEDVNTARSAAARAAMESVVFAPPCVGAMSARRPSSTSPSEVTSTPSTASATSCSPSILSVGWWFDTPRYAAFFRAEINAVTLML